MRRFKGGLNIYVAVETMIPRSNRIEWRDKGPLHQVGGSRTGRTRRQP